MTTARGTDSRVRKESSTASSLVGASVAFVAALLVGLVYRWLFGDDAGWFLGMGTVCYLTYERWQEAQVKL